MKTKLLQRVVYEGIGNFAVRDFYLAYVKNLEQECDLSPLVKVMPTNGVEAYQVLYNKVFGKKNTAGNFFFGREARGGGRAKKKRMVRCDGCYTNVIKPLAVSCNDFL